MKRIKTVLSVAGLLSVMMFFNQDCQSQTAAPAPTGTPPPAAVPAASAAAPSVKAKVAFTGAAPVMAKLKREADPFCAKTPMVDQEVVVNPNGTLKNVVVRITQGATPLATPPANPLEIDQMNCMYSPRIVGGVTGQKILIKNGDPILHNVHTYVGTTTGFNQAQMKGSKEIEKTITMGITKFKCDVHPWMTGYVVGNDNPYICLTGDTGECDLSNVPAGSYTIEAWHEKYGAKTTPLTVVAGQPAVVNFSFAAQ